MRVALTTTHLPLKDVPAAGGRAPQAAALPPLRQELLLHRAPDSHDGTPTWTLEDPGRNLFFQIGWAEAEMLARWALRSPQRIAQAIGRETALQTTAAEVEELGRFLDQQGLLQQSGPQACARYQREAQARRSSSWWSWVIHHYLFFRIPLLRPDALLVVAHHAAPVGEGRLHAKAQIGQARDEQEGEAEAHAEFGHQRRQRSQPSSKIRL